MRHQVLLPVFFATLVAFNAVSCTLKRRTLPADPSTTMPAGPISTDPNVTLKFADVESVHAVWVPTLPPTVRVTIKGLLNDGATRIHDIQIQQDASGVTLTVITSRPRSASATMALIPFERELTVTLEARPKGPFTVTVNGVATTAAEG